jgi:hypothetical protein
MSVSFFLIFMNFFLSSICFSEQQRAVCSVCSNISNRSVVMSMFPCIFEAMAMRLLRLSYTYCIGISHNHVCVHLRGNGEAFAPFGRIN